LIDGAPMIASGYRAGESLWACASAVHADGRDGPAVYLSGGRECKVVTRIDDHSRFVVCAKIVGRATARPVCGGYWRRCAGTGFRSRSSPTTARCSPPGSLWARDRWRSTRCRDNGITHLLTAPYSLTTTGKVERLHKTIRAEFLTEHDGVHARSNRCRPRGQVCRRGQHRAPTPSLLQRQGRQGGVHDAARKQVVHLVELLHGAGLTELVHAQRYARGT
jgi:transposase InsO family protein